jgi:3',5'-cyclic AMP phosphodiesterase CpdA
MRIWPISDVHMGSTRGWDLSPLSNLPPFDVAVIAGDLTTRMERGVKWIHERIPTRPCVYVSGNHEAYGTDIDVTVAKARVAAKGTNVFVLQNDVQNIDGVDFLGCTLWTSFNLFGDRHQAMVTAGARMNDYKRIRIDNYRRRLQPRDTLARHNESVAFLEKELARSKGGRQVVVTHHKPIANDRDLKSVDDYPDVIQAAYSSDLSRLFFDGPSAWVFGHTHESVNTTIGRTRLVSNARGYGNRAMSENPRFDQHFTFEI